MIRQLALSFLLAASAEAAPITWGPAKDIAADSDVSTNGVVVKAVCKAPGNPVVNGVTFTPAYSGDSLSGQNATGAAAGALLVGGGISAAYAAMLGGNDYSTTSGATLTLTLNDLTVGQHYEVQVWANDSDASSLGKQTVKSSGALDQWVVLDMNTTAAEGGKGQFATGTFTADATSQQVKITGSGSPVIQAYQLRRITAPLAAVAWERWQETTGDSDVSTVGTPVKAYVFGPVTPAAPINGVSFTRFALQATDAITGMTNTSSAFGSTSAPFVNLSTDYKTLVGHARWSATKHGSLTLNGLTAGQWYVVQVWVNDSRASTGGRWTRINGSTYLSYNPGGPSDNLAYEGGLGHHMSGTFRAGAASQRFDFGANASAQINALQLRAIPTQDALAREAKQRNQHALIGYMDGRITSSSRFDGVHLAFGSGDFARGRSEMSSSSAWLANNGYTFDIWPAIDATIRWKKYVDAASRNIVKGRLKSVNYTSPGTSNLVKLSQTIRFLGSEEFGEDAFDHPADDWRPSDPNGRNWLIDKLRQESMTGLSEFGSNDYGNLNSLPSLSLGQLAQDPEMRAAGTTSFTAFMAQLAAVWQPLEYYAGVWSSRSYEDQSGYYGTYGRELYQALGGGGRTGDGKAMAVIAASGFTLPSPILHAANDRTTSYSVRHRGDGYQQAFVNANNYTLFGSTDGRASGSGWCWGYGVRWRGMKNFFWLMGCATDNSEDIWSSSNHGKMQLDFDILLHRDSMLYAFDKSHPLARDPRYAQAQVPGGYQAMINDSATSGRIFLHYGTVMIAVASDVLFNWDPNAGIHSPRNTPQPGDSEFRIAVGGVGYPQNDPNFAATISATNNRFAVAIETALPTEFAGADAAAQLAAYKTALLATTSISHMDVTVATYKITRGRYVNRHGDIIEKESYNDDRTLRGGWINGVAVDYANWPKQQNPWMSTTPSGDVLTVTSGNQRAVLNYNPRPTPMAIVSSTVPPAAAAPEVTTLVPAGLTETTATLVGEVVSTGTSSVSVTAYWGTTDGGTTAASWANSIPLGVQPLGQVLAPVSNLTANTLYRVRFAATNASGTVWSPATVAFTTAQAPPPARPDGLATTPTTGSVPLTWNAASGATSYTIRRGTVSGTYTALASGITVTSYTDSTASTGTTYYYVVAAVAPGGTSANSGEVTGTPAVTPAVPGGLAVTQVYIYPELRWAAVPFATSYTVKRATTSGGPFTTVASGLATPSYNDTTALNGSAYFWVISATNVAGESANSGQVTLTVNVASFINLTAGNWNAVTWIPNPPGQPTPSSTAAVDFQNSSAIASSNNMGTFALNKLRFLNQSVTLSGNALNFSGSGPTVTSGVPSVAHSIANALTLGADTTFDIAANTLTVSGVISGANDLFKSGAGTLNLTGANIYTGHTYLGGGTLRYGGTNSSVKTLFFGDTAGDTTASTLDVQANVTALALTTQTDVTAGENLAIIGVGRILTVGGALTMGGLNSGTAENSHLTFSGAGALVCNFGTNASIRRGSILDLSALGSASFTGSNLNVGDIDNYTVANPSTIIIPADGATTLNIANLNLDSATAGGGTSRGESATFLAPDGTGLLTIRGATGGTSRANLLMDKHAGSGTGTTTVTFDARGHGCDMLLANLEIGRRSGTHASGNGTAFFHFDSGALDVSNVVPVAFCEGAPSNTATVTLGGGTIVFTGGLNLASHSGTTSTRHATATLTIDGNASVTSGPVTMAALTGTVATHNSTATLSLLGGSLTMTGNIQRGLATGTGTSSATLSMKGGLLNMAGFSIGTAANPLTTLTFESGTLRNIGGINGTASLVKSSAETLVLDGTNTYPGATTIQDGVLSIGDGAASGTLGSGAVTNEGTLLFNRSDTALVVANVIGGSGDIIIGTSSDGVFTSEVTFSGANTFTGPVQILNGGLRITHAEALGSGTKNITMTNGGTGRPRLILNGSKGDIVLPASLTFVTSNDNTTQPAIVNEAGNNSIAGAITLSSGAGNTRIRVDGGTLTLAGNITPNATGRTLNLDGAGDGIIAGSLLNGTGSNIPNLAKSGTGTWTLTGTGHTFTVATTVNAGTLAVNGPLTTASAVTVNTNGTLAGSGSIGSATTVNGRHSPGATSPATLTHTAAVSYGSASRIVWQLNANIADGTHADRIAATAITVAAGAKIDITLNNPGSAVDFTNDFWRTARTWNVVTHTTRTGTLALGTPTSDIGGRSAAAYGTFALNHTATAVALTWTPYTALQMWRYQYFGTVQNTGSAADLFDGNGDGEVNLIEFATSQSPVANTRAALGLARNGATLEFTYTRNKAATDLEYLVKWSDSLAPGPWSTVGISDQNPAPLTETAGTETLRILVPAGSIRRFVRLEVTQP